METETLAQLKIKINNSYESEPSSGSGSSLGDQNDGPMSDEENIHFPYLVKSATTKKVKNSSETKDSTSNNYKTNDSKNDRTNRKLVYGRPAHSSQESPFEGFGDTASDESLRDPMDDLIMNYNTKVKKYNKSNKNDTKVNIKSSYSSYYDMVEDNSCNAVDLLLSNDPVIKKPITSSSNENREHPPDLSFNGKIKNLGRNPQTNDVENLEQETDQTCGNRGSNTNSKVLQRQANVLELSLNTSQFTESFILKKYSNERSPDLFGDDEDEDENDEDQGSHAKGKEEQEQEGDPVPEQERNETEFQQIHHNEEQSHFESNNDSVLEHGEDTKNEEVTELADSSGINHSLNCPTETSFADDLTMDGNLQINPNDPLTLYRNNCRKERELLKRIKKCLAGVPPPPSFTIPQIDMFNNVLDKKTEILNFFNSKEIEAKAATSDILPETTNIFKPTHSLEEVKKMGWREILGVRHLGVNYNLNKASESNEYLSLSVIERFIGAETASSYRNSPSSAKKRISRLKMLTQSPGNRLSHLARRRAIFSSANLASTSLKSTTSLGPQIVIDKKKSKNRRKGTPKRMTPASKKKCVRKTPSSSARKLLFRTDLIKPGPSRETSKRALFQSPAKQNQKIIVPIKPLINPEIANRVEKSKRALFSPEIKTVATSSSASSSLFSSNSTNVLPQLSIKHQFAPKASPQLETLLKRKRNLLEDDEDVTGHQTNKLFKGNGENLTPRALKIKSQSFCIGAGSSMSGSTDGLLGSNLLATKQGLSSSQTSINIGINNRNSMKLQRASSEMTAPNNNLTENQKKKLLWAVSQALQEKKITSKHECFKQYASILARVVKRIFTEYYQKSSTSNSETMLRLAKRYAYHVISGKNLDDIYLQAKAQIDESKRQLINRPSGYIGPEEYQQRKLSQQLSQTSLSNTFTGSMQNIFSTENSIDSFNVTLSETSSRFCSNSSSSSALTNPQNIFLEHLSQEKLNSQNSFNRSCSKQLPIQNNSSGQNSSSKSNLGGLALRENVDGEQRRSAQKNFTGKDQRNVSPYIKTNASSNNTRSLMGSGRKIQSEYFNEIHANGGGKVKRQILFDS